MDLTAKADIWNELNTGYAVPVGVRAAPRESLGGVHDGDFGRRSVDGAMAGIGVRGHRAGSRQARGFERVIRWRIPWYNEAAPPSRRAAEPPSRRAAEPPSRRAALSASPWRRLGHSASRPESSASAGRRSDTRRPASFSDSFDLSPVRAAAGSRAATRRLRRGLFSALLCLPLLLGFAAGAQAQVLASNIGQADGGTVTFQRDHAMLFRPGLNPGGYRLESVDIEFASATSSAFDSNVLAVEIRRSDVHLRVGELVGRLTNPQGTSFAADRRIRFTAPGGGIDLEPKDGPTDGRGYFLVLDVAGQRDADFAKIRTTTSTADDAGGAAGFNIGEGFNLRMAGDNTAGGWTWVALKPLKIRLNGTVKAPPAPPGLEFSTTHLTWNESKGCGEFEYYDPSGNKITGNTPQERRQNALDATLPLVGNQLGSRGASMELPAGAPGPTYRVRLTTKPSETVKVNIHDPNDLIWWGNNGHRTLNRVLVGGDRRASNGRGGAGKPTLTFTPSNWNDWQTVKVKVACTDHFPDAVPLKHVIQGEQGYFDDARRRVNYGELDQSWTVWVRVNDETPPVEIVASGLPPAGETITLAKGATRDFKITIGEAMLPIGSSGRVDVHLFAEPIGNVIRATRRDGQPLVDGVLMDTMTFTNSSREQWVRLEAVGAGDTRLVVSAERDFTWAHETRRHWSPEWPVTVTVEHAGICGRTKAVRDAILGMIGVSNCADVTPEHLAGISGDFQNDFLNLFSKGLSSLKAGDFDGLINLKRLRLTRNSLSTLPAGIFDDLTGLLALDLNYNQLTTLRPSVFDRLTELKYLYLNNNSLAVLPDGVFRNNLALATHRLDGNPGANFTPTANTGTDRTVATDAEVTLSGTATGPWAENDIAWHWRQVDGPYSDGVVQEGVQRDGQTATFTAPATATVMHFRLAAIPKVLVESRPKVSGATPPPVSIRERGIFDGFAWVTITVEGGQGSPQEDAQPAQVEEAACVSDALLADARKAAGETWRTSPGHVERWSRVLAAFGVNNAWSSNPMTVAEARAQADRGLKRWAPVAPALECLAAAPEEQPEQAEVQPVTPATPKLSLRAGSAVDEGGHADFTVTADPAPQSDLTVTWTVAQSGEYLDAPGAGSRTVTLKAGTTSTDLSVATVDDAADEADGSVSVTLGTGTGYTIATGKGSAAVAVRDNDEPVVSIAAGNGVTEGAAASFTVSASPVPAAPLDVTLTVGQSGDFAASGETGSRTVTVPVTGSVDVEVATVDDGADEPDGSITATLGTSTGYTLAAAPDNAATVAVSDNDAASSGPTLSIADATFNENAGRVHFTVTLSEPVDRTVTVRFATRDSTPVSARADQDYLAWKRSWQVWARFRPGETETQIFAYIYNDSHDEDPETFEMVLFDASDGVSIADGVAVGTITNSDPMPAAWLARFGRTAAEQALDGIAGRIAAPRGAGVQGSVAGQALNLDPESQSGAANDNAGPGNLADEDLLARSDVARAFGADGWGGGAIGHDAHGFATGPVSGAGDAGSYTMTGLEALLGSSFTATGEKDGMGGSLAFWGRAAQSSFDGREGTFSLDGEATSAMLGADYARGKWLIGLALMRSSGEGGYADRESGPQHCPDVGEGMDPATMAHLCGGAVREGDGKVEASLTAAVPYAAIQASEHLKLWGAAGHGTGEVTLKPEVGGSLSSDIAWTMAAAGVRNDLVSLSKEGSGLALALTSDALWARTSSEKTHELAASESDVTRLRLGLEGSWRIATEGGGSVTPKLEIGARHDGGDAETGFGVELGGGLAWVDPALGLSLDLSGRTLVAHGSDDLEDRGFAASLAFDPDPATARGPSLTLTQDWGGAAQGGLDALFASDPLADRTGGGEAAARWTAEAAWGFPACRARGASPAARMSGSGWPPMRATTASAGGSRRRPLRQAQGRRKRAQHCLRGEGDEAGERLGGARTHARAGSYPALVTAWPSRCGQEHRGGRSSRGVRLSGTGERPGGVLSHARRFLCSDARSRVGGACTREPPIR